MSCSGCNSSIDCPGDDAFPYSLTPLVAFPWVINCPEGVDCFSALSVTMDCCDSPTTLDIPAGTSEADRLTLLNQLIQQCLFLQNVCDDGGGGGGPDDPPPSPPSDFWLNAAQTAYWTCADRYGGGSYYYTIRAGSFMAESLAGANALALDAATKFVKDNHFCANPPCLCPCADVATVINIPLVGRHGPFTYSIDSGVLPTGMTVSIVGGLVKLTGTPTVTGLTTVTLKIFDAVGGYLLKTLAVYVLKISTTSPLPDYANGVAYSKQIVGEGGTGDYAFSITAGSLPSGLSMSSAGLITGTPTSTGSKTFTVKMLDTTLGQITGCTKEFTMTDAARVFYYKLDEIITDVADYALNSVPSPEDHNLDLPLAGVTYLSVVTGKIDDAFQATHLGIPQAPRTKTLDSDGNGFGAYLNITNKSWTIRFWMKHPTNFFDTGIYMLWVADVDREFGIRLTYLNNAGEFPQNRYRVEVDNGDFSLPELSLESALIDGVTTWQDWHRVVVVWDNAAKELKIKINNDAFETQGAPGFTASDLSRALTTLERGGSSAFEHYIMDELAVINGKAWTTADCTYDWNGGAGRTYPDLP